MTDDHKHIWAASGCYCGAQRCVFEKAHLHNGRLVRKKGLIVMDRCKEPAKGLHALCATPLEVEGGG